MNTTISAEQRDALLEKVQSLPDGAIVRVTAIAVHYDAAGQLHDLAYVTVGPLHTNQRGFRYVGETNVVLPLDAGPAVAARVQAVEVISAAAGESA